MKTQIRTTRAFLSVVARCVSTIGFIAIFAFGATAQTNTFPSSGNAGVGTTTPTYKLQVSGNGGTVGDSVLVTDSNSTTTALDVENTSTGAKKWRLQSVGSGVSGRVGNFEFVEIGSNLKALVIQPGGNIGIGTTSPSLKLDVGGWTGFPGDVNGASANVSGDLFAGNTGSGVGRIRFASNAYQGFVGWNTYYNGSALKSMDTTSAGWMVQVGGSNNNGSDQFVVQRAPATTGAQTFASLFSITHSGHVGLGTTTPGFGGITSSNYLTLAASGSNRPAFEFVSNLPDGIGQEAGFLDFVFNTNAAGHKRLGNISVDTEGATANQRGGVMRFFTKANGVATPPERMRIDSAGNLGIGTTGPTNLLHVNSGTGPSSQFRLSANSAGSLSGLSYTADNAALGFDVDYSTGVGWIARHGSVAALYKLGGKLQVLGWNGATVGNPIPDWTTHTSLDLATGRFGIGIASPAYKLDVQGGQINSSGGLCIAGDCKTNWSQVGGNSQWTTSGSNIYYNTGSVGMGNSSPRTYATLDLNTSNNKSLYTMDSTNGGLLIGYQGSTIQARQTNDGNNQNLILQNWGGNVGIGTSTPGTNYKLDVAGNINSSGTITGNNIVAKYQDVAEWVPSSEELAAGTVVVLDTTKSNQVISSTAAYDTRVAGVISAQPGIALGESGEGKVLVATTGRVRVKVDASRGPIQIGDLLVTSDITGMAMKSEAVSLGGVQIHRPGTIIGKALEPLAKGKSEILVLLSLQ